MQTLASRPVAPDISVRQYSPKILFICDAFLPHAGGARVYYHNLFRSLASEGRADVTVLTKKVPGWEDFDRAESDENFRVIRCGKPLKSRRYQEWPKILVPFCRAIPLLAGQPFDLIHFGDLYPPGVLSLWFKGIFGKPYVGYAHGEEITQTDLRKFQPIVRNKIYRGADIVVAANEFAKQNLLRIGVSEGQIRKITPGVDCVRFRPGEPRRDLVERYGLEGKKVILTVARLTPRKGHKGVLAAIRSLAAETPDFVYLIVGTGPEEKNLKELAAEWGIADRVRFAGFVKDADLPDYYNLCDVFAMPNFEEEGTGDIEGFGMVFLEANACGKAVVGGRSGGTTEAVLHGITGALVNPLDSCELTDILRSLLLTPNLRHRLGEQGLARARGEFSWASRARLLDEANREILDRRQIKS